MAACVKTRHVAYSRYVFTAHAIPMTTLKSTERAREHEARVIVALGTLGWARAEDLAAWLQWPGASATPMARRTCERLVEEDPRLATETKLGYGMGTAYMLNLPGERKAAALGAQIIGRARDLSIGERAHEHLMAMHTVIAMRASGWTGFFARQVHWSSTKKGRNARGNGEIHIAGMELTLPPKLPDALLIKGNHVCLVELEWSPKRGEEMRRQMKAVVAAVRSGKYVLFAYVHPPAMQSLLFKRRGLVEDGAVDHEQRLVNRLHALGLSHQELVRVRLLRLVVDPQLRLLSHEMKSPTDFQPRALQPTGDTTAAHKAVASPWTKTYESTDGNRREYAHRNGGLLRVERGYKGASEGWRFLAWYSDPTDPEDPSGTRTADATRRLVFQDLPDDDFVRAAQRAKRWFELERDAREGKAPSEPAPTAAAG